MKNKYELINELEQKKVFTLSEDVFYDYIESEIFDDSESLVNYLISANMVTEDGSVILPKGTKLEYKGDSNRGGLGYLYFEINDRKDIDQIVFSNDVYFNQDLIKAIGL